MICTTGILLASATVAVAVLSDGGLSRNGTRRSQPQQARWLETAEPNASIELIGLKTTDFRSSMLPPLATPDSIVKTGAPVSVIEAARMVDKADEETRTPQGSSDPGEGMPTLAIDQVIAARPHQPTAFPLSVNTDGVVPDHALIAIHGLPKGTVLSAGRADGAGGWILSPDDLGTGLTITPSGESSDLVIQFLTPQGRVANELHARLIVSAGAEAGDTPQADAATTPEEIQVLLSHGRDLQRVGYLAGARLFFRRAAEAGSAEGARALGETYDPTEFQKLGVRGMTPDPALAQKWYDRARALEAQHAKQTGTAE